MLFVASAFAMTASAAIPKKASVMTELEQLHIGGEPFNEAKYPVNKNRDDIEILAVSEKGFRTLTSSSGYGLFIYVYNPSCMVFDVSSNNTVQIGLNLNSKDYSFYGLELMSRSDDHRFYKYKVVGYGNNVVSELYQQQEKVTERIYNVPVVRLSSGNTLTAYPIKKVYIFSGYDAENTTLTCSVRDAEVIEVELYDTTWVSPNAGDTISGKEVDKYDHYEIHSIYFTLDRDYLNTYEFISSIRASYNAMKLTPIVVSREGNLTDATVNAILNATYVNGGEDIDDLAAIRKFSLFLEVDWWYSETNIDFGNYEANNRYSQLAYYFENNDLPEDFDMDGVYSMLGFSSDELEAYYDHCVSKGYHPSVLYSENTGSQEIDFSYKDMFNLKTYTQDLKGISKWWHNLTTKKDSYLNDSFITNAKKIQVVDNPSLYANMADSFYKQYGDELLINECDMEQFKEVCAKAASNDQVVIILRYAVADYRCVPLYDVWEVSGSLWGTEDPVAMSIEKWAYTDISVAQIGFTTNGVEVIVPVASNVVDSFGDGIVFEDPTDKNGPLPGDGGFNWKGLWDDLLAKLKVIGIVIAIVAVVVVVIWITPSVVRAFSAVGTARRQKKLEKQLQNKKNKKE